MECSRGKSRIMKFMICDVMNKVLQDLQNKLYYINSEEESTKRDLEKDGNILFLNIHNRRTKRSTVRITISLIEIFGSLFLLSNVRSHTLKYILT
jgi:hypothetical protein